MGVMLISCRWSGILMGSIESTTGVRGGSRLSRTRSFIYLFPLAERPPVKYLARIRSNLLLFIKPIILQQNQPTTGEAFYSNGEELDCLLNYLSTVKEVYFCPPFFPYSLFMVA